MNSGLKYNILKYSVIHIFSLSLKNKVTLITGSSRGIGFAMAKYFAENCESQVVISSRKKIDNDKTIKKINGKVYSVNIDVTNIVNIRNSIDKIIKKFSSIDILINNAGYKFNKKIWYKKLHQIDYSYFEQVLDVDLMGSLRVSKTVIPYMIKNSKIYKQNNYVIINISSTPALSGHNVGSPYTIAKSGVIGLTKHIAREYGCYNIRAYTLALGNIATSSTYHSMSKKHQLIAEKEPSLKRWGKPKEVAQIAASLSDDSFSYTTGNTILIDGGTIMF